MVCYGYFGLQCLGFRVWGTGSGSRALGFGLRAQGSGLRAWGSSLECRSPTSRISPLKNLHYNHKHNHDHNHNQSHNHNHNHNHSHNHNHGHNRLPIEPTSATSLPYSTLRYSYPYPTLPYPTDGPACAVTASTPRKISKEPNRKNVEATRVSTPQRCSTFSPV